MREIKFRVWRKGEMIFPEMAETLISLMGLKQSDDYVLLQFTGLKDKAGHEIYEGDIVKHNNGTQQVRWHEASASFQMFLSNWVLDQEVGFDARKVQVIGNIYENPELLEGVHE